jgi:hypothetical protein
VYLYSLLFPLLYVSFFCHLFLLLSDKTELAPLNLRKLSRAIALGRIDTSMPIDMKALYDANVVTKIVDGVKLLADVRYD